MEDMINTTIYVNLDTLKKIETIKASNQKKSREIISDSLNLFMKEKKLRLKNGKAVEYQKKDSCTKWKKLHVRFNAIEYELYTDQRKFFKKSVSLLVAIAIDYYYKRFFVGFNNYDNYQKNEREIAIYELGNSTFFQIEWKKNNIMQLE